MIRVMGISVPSLTAAWLGLPLCNIGEIWNSCPNKSCDIPGITDRLQEFWGIMLCDVFLPMESLEVAPADNNDVQRLEDRESLVRR